MLGSFTDPAFLTVMLANVKTAPFGVRTLEIIFVPFFRLGRVTDKFLVLFIVSDAFFAEAENAMRFTFDVVVEMKLFVF